MRKLLRFLLLLYPRWWRERYAEEFQALSEDARFGASDYLDIIRGAAGVRMNVISRKPVWKVLTASALLGILAGVGMAFVWPRSYHSSAVIRVGHEQRPTGVAAAALWETAMSSATIEQAIRSNGLYEGSSRTQAERLSRLRRDSRMSIVREAQDAVMIQYVGSNPITAQRVTEALVHGIKEASAPSLTVDVIDPPSLDKDPISPNVRNVIFTGGLAGLLCGFVVVALTMRLRRDPPLRHA